MASDIFVDAGGFYSLLVKGDDAHAKAKTLLRLASRRRRTFVTTDHVVDETAALLKAGGFAPLAKLLFETLEDSRAIRILWTDASRFQAAQAFFLKHSDQAWSFTDCLSICAMRELKIREMLTKNARFTQVGFIALLA